MRNFDKYLDHLVEIHRHRVAPSIEQIPETSQVEQIESEMVHYEEIDTSLVDPNATLTRANIKRRYRDPRIVLHQDGKTIKEIFIHQSMIRAMLKNGTSKDYCPLQIYETMIGMRRESIPTLSMQYGNYFEAGCLNNGVNKHGEILELPLLKRTGLKSTAHKRIDEQIFNFRENVSERLNLLIDPHLIWRHEIFEDVDKSTVQDLGFKIYVEMEFDLISPLRYAQFNLDLAIIDLKLTGDRNGCFGDYCWGNPSEMDHIQAFVYGFSMNLPFFYLVFDYKAIDRGWKLVPINVNTEDPNPKVANEAMLRKRLMFQSIRTTALEIQHNHIYGWKTNPSADNCRICPLKNCPDRQRIYVV